MADYSSCPNCGRKAKNNFLSQYFPVYMCKGNCSTTYCKECGPRGCPSCGSTKYNAVAKVYAKQDFFPDPAKALFSKKIILEHYQVNAPKEKQELHKKRTGTFQKYFTFFQGIPHLLGLFSQKTAR